MKTPRTLAEAASFALFKRFLPLIFFGAVFGLAIPVFLLGEKYQIEVLRSIGGLVLIVGLPAAFFISREIVIRMEEDRSVLFSQALAHTLYRYLTYLCFLPIVGPALQRFLERKREKNPFTSDGE